MVLQVRFVLQNKDLAYFLNLQPHDQFKPLPLLPGVGEHTRVLRHMIDEGWIFSVE